MLKMTHLDKDWGLCLTAFGYYQQFQGLGIRLGLWWGEGDDRLYFQVYKKVRSSMAKPGRVLEYIMILGQPMANTCY